MNVSFGMLLLQDELEAELEQLEEQLLQSVATVAAAPVHVPAGKQPTWPILQNCTGEEHELGALQVEMAL